MAAGGAAPPKTGQAGGAYFEKKGEVHELRQLLRGAAADRDQQKKRDAIKKVIAYMTLGIDVSPLFSEMIMASATNDLVQKKMVYLYLVNYSESNSELAILAINTLQKDCQDDDPMIRGLALRCLCSLNLANMIEYLTPAVQRSLGDVNGYVRKTAVIGVVKLYHISRSSVAESGIGEKVKGLLMDNDPHVVANAVVAVEEVFVDEGGIEVTKEIVTHLMNRIMQFSEWGQCTVLRLLIKYEVKDESEMFDIMNMLDALLKQSSSSVVLAVTKVFLDLTSNRPDLQTEVLRRLKGPLLTLMAAATPELAYCVLVHIQSLCSRGGATIDSFCPEFKQFFCRYNEPSYIKSVKIDILTMLADINNSEAIVAELSEYVTDVDAVISRQAIGAIGKIAVRNPSTAELIVGSLTNLLELDIDYVSTEAAVVMKDLVRKYPDQFQRASGAVERCIRIVSEPEGKCAVLWILGEYGLLIEDAPYLLEPMIDGFVEETSNSVRLEMLTAAVKLFFCRPPEMQAMLGRLLSKAIQECTQPDLRDRALLYYRLLELSPEEARRVICAPKEVVEEFQEEIDKDIKARSYEEFNTLSVVYKQPPSKFVLSKPPSSLLVATKMQCPQTPDGYQMPEQTNGGGGVVNGVFDEPLMDTGVSHAPAVGSMADSADLLGEDLGSSMPPASSQPAPQSSGMGDLLGMDDLLGGDMGMPAAPAAPRFALQPGAALDGNAFQDRWSKLPQLPNQIRQMRGMISVPINTASIEQALRAGGVQVIASGNIPPGNAMKFFLYAKQASGPAPMNPGDIWFLMELIVTPGATANLTLKVDNAQPPSTEGFLSALWGALDAFVA